MIKFLPLILLYCFYTLFSLSEKKASEIFSIDHIAKSSSLFSQSYYYVGKLGTLPCTLSYKGNRLHANVQYAVEGKLEKKGMGKYHFRATHAVAKKPVHSLEEKRFLLKRRVKKAIERHVDDPLVAALYSAIATGENQNWELAALFEKVGLQHLLAISGLHFALFAALMQALFFFLPRRLKRALTLLGITLLFLYYGPIPSVKRAYVMIALFLTADLFSLRKEPRHFFILAFVLVLLLEPLDLFRLGFQLSFAATGALLFLYPKMEAQTFFQKNLALSLSASAATLPFLLFYFGTFPLHSIIYNLFLPHLFTFTLFLFPFPKVAEGFLTFVTSLPSQLEFFLTPKTLFYLFFSFKKVDQKRPLPSQYISYGDHSSAG